MLRGILLVCYLKAFEELSKYCVENMEYGVKKVYGLRF